MKIVFMGSSDFGIPALESLHKIHEVAAVVTRPDTMQGRGLKSQPTPVKNVAQSLGIPVIEPMELSDSLFVKHLEEFGAELFFVTAFRILPRKVFAIPPKGTINLHASLLPDYRGPAPINWAIINGDLVTGLTTFYIDDKVDTGDIIANVLVPIDRDETAGELTERMKVIGADLAVGTLTMIERSCECRLKQPHPPIRLAPKLAKEDGRIDWSQSAEAIFNHIRGMNPTPGAFVQWSRGGLKIHRAKVEDADSQGVPGSVAVASPNDGIVISCGKGQLRLLDVQPEGKNAMDGASFVRGYRLQEGISISEQ
jgi:methionyl-tRNA formyltransferase